MPIIRNYNQVKDIYKKAGELGIGLPVICSEDRETLEAILAAAYEIGKEIGNNSIPVTPAWTSRYHVRGQATLVSHTGDAIVGCKLMFSDLKVFMSDTSPYKDLLVMPHLDHAMPWDDMDILLEFTDDFASVMCDASEKPYEENVELTSNYVKKVKGKVVVEGCVDEISSSEGGEHEELTTVEKARDYIERTGVDIIVPNLGTEHRSSKSEAEYNSKRAREITAALGKVICLHGSSSVKREDLHKLPEDGIIKINLYTAIARSGGQALVNHVLENLGNIFDKCQIEKYVSDGILGEAVLKDNFKNTIPPIKPKLEYYTNPKRRDAWFNAVKDRCKDYMYQFNYENFSGLSNLI